MKGQYKNLLTTIWRFAEGKRKKLCLVYGMFVVANLLIMLEPYFMGKFFEVLQNDGGFGRAIFFLGAFASMSFFFWMFHGPARCMERILSFEIWKNFLTNMFRTITELPLKWHKDHHSGETIDKVNKAGNALREFTEDAYVYIEAIIPFFVSLGAIILIMGWYGLLLLGVSIVVFVVINRFDVHLIANVKKTQEREHGVSSVFFDYVSNIVTIITLRLEELAKNEYIQKIKHIFPVFRKNVVINEGKWFAVSILMAGANFTVICIYTWQNYKIDHLIDIGKLVMLMEYTRRFIEVFFGIAWKYESLVMKSTKLTAIDSIINAHDKLYVIKKSEELTSWNDIYIRDLRFRYEDTEHKTHTLDNIHIHLQKGRKIALVGSSGSGKSTLMTILRGLDTPDRVKVVIDKRQFSDTHVLSSTTTLIPQNPEIFEHTIAYNITMGIAHKKNDLETAAKIARFLPIVTKLPHGFQTNIREKGVNLSGGEQQRLALARGIFAAKESSILLLDEPTSSVDTANEREIYRHLFEHFPQKCIVSSIHRLHLLPLFDTIYVLKNGTVVEHGSFRELLASGGELSGMWANYQENPEGEEVLQSSRRT